MMRLLAIVTLLSMSACSLMGLDDFTLKTCVDDDDCLVFNELEGLPEGCHLFYCQDGACLRRPEGQELYDQLDNDCDGVIDEPSLDGEQTISAQGTAVVTELATNTTTAFAVDAVGAVSAVWWDDDGSAWFAPVTDSSGLGQPMTYQRGAHEPGNDNGNLPNLRELDLEEGCYRRSGTEVVQGICDFSSVTVGLASDLVLAATINIEGCAPGQLRLGYFDRSLPPNVAMRGPYRRSSTYLGVDINETGFCTGGSRPGCGAGGAPCGVTRPAMAVLDGEPVQGLIGWTGDVLARPRCGGGEAPIEILGAFVMTGSLGEDFGWVTGSNEGMPQTLGTTTGGGPPAMIALPDRGYLVGFGDEGGRLSLHYVPVAERPPEYDGYSCLSPCDFEDRSDQITSPLSDMVQLATLENDGDTDYVALAPGAASEGRLELGAAWLQGCGGDNSAIVVRRIIVETTTGGEPSGVAEQGDVVILSLSGADIVGPPSIVYASRGFVTEGFERGGSGPATSETDGGWLVAWVQREGGGNRLVARRVSELDGLPLDDSELIDLTTEGFEPASDAPAPALTIQGDTIRYAYHDLAGQQILSGELPLVRLTR